MTRIFTPIMLALLALLVSAAVPATDAHAAEPTWSDVGRWERFEGVIANPKPYRDPFADVSLEVTYQSPDGRTVKFWGFHDGGRTWRFRFMPDTLGTWSYQAAFSDGTPGASGKFECVASSVPGPIARNQDNPLWVGRKDGDPVLLRSLHVGDRLFAGDFAPAKRKAFLDWAGRQGYNMLTVASPAVDPAAAAGRARAGRNTPNLWPLAPEPYRQFERNLDDLSARRMVVLPFADLFGRGTDLPRDSKDQTRFLKYALAPVSYTHLTLLTNREV